MHLFMFRIYVYILARAYDKMRFTAFDQFNIKFYEKIAYIHKERTCLAANL